ncbi:MAG: phosphoribosylamine--glycine ligase [Myxococcaceae bacterium]
MRVLVLGGGGREHAICWKLRQSPRLADLYCAPGNPGTAQLATNVQIKADDPAAVVKLCAERKIDLVVVGPEAPLVAGVADALIEAKVPVFGPTKAGARVEGSKAFAKDVMAKAGIPTAAYRTFTDPKEAETWAFEHAPIVIKADGLAAGKGVVVAKTKEEAALGVRELSGLGAAAGTLLLEELLDGEELSVIALCDGERYALLPPARDHKRVGDGDTGPNTGGMGAYSPAPLLDEVALRRVGEEVIAPALAELARRGAPFRGALYAGLMVGKSGTKVLEFNARLGDPETQVLMMQLDEDLLTLFEKCAKGELEQRPLRVKAGVSVGVVAAAPGYPQAPRTGSPIRGLDAVSPDAVVFHAGTRAEGKEIVTAGGRVLTVCAHGTDMKSAREKAYEALRSISFDGMHFRSDIGGH